MDAKSRANFINSVASGSIIVCPKCNTKNPSDSKYCMKCGADLTSAASKNMTARAVFEQAKAIKEAETANAAPAEPAKEKEVKVVYVEPAKAFAEGLPEWSLEPPHTMVRRHKVHA